MGLLQFLRRAAPRPGQSGAAPSASMPGVQAVPEIYGPPREAIQETLTQQKGAMADQAPMQTTNEDPEDASEAVQQAKAAQEAGPQAQIQFEAPTNATPG